MLSSSPKGREDGSRTGDWLVERNAPPEKVPVEHRAEGAAPVEGQRRERGRGVRGWREEQPSVLITNGIIPLPRVSLVYNEG